MRTNRNQPTPRLRTFFGRAASRDALALLAGVAAAVSGVGAALVAADLDSPLRAPFALFLLLAAPALAIGSVLRRFTTLTRCVLSAAGAVAIDLTVAQMMLTFHLWSFRGGVATVAGISALLLLVAVMRNSLTRRARRSSAH
ncbi:hypothetical protein ACH44C_23535 [Streptomyces purpureus]|uniref:hypothetical protein n=1 Tax=Streptomyces purpureus TaxID=1951 RepID=UPI0037AE26DB